MLTGVRCNLIVGCSLIVGFWLCFFFVLIFYESMALPFAVGCLVGAVLGATLHHLDLMKMGRLKEGKGD